MHSITILHTEGCGSAPEAAGVARAVAASRDDVTVELALIENEAQAVARQFRGSPTVLVDGRDVEEDPRTPVGTMG